MNRNRIVVLVAALVCVGGLALAAATIEGPQRSNAGLGDGDGTGMGNGSGGFSPPDVEEPVGPPIPDWVFDVITALLVLAVIAGVYTLIRDFDLEYLRTIVAIFGGVLLLLVIVALFASEGAPGGMSGGGGGSGIGSPQSDPTSDPFSAPIVFLGAFGLLALLLIGTIAKLSATSKTIEQDVYPIEEDEDEEESVQEIAEAAARAADTIEDDSGVENAVYQAWQEMTAAVNVERPQTTTPEEFATAAVDAGMAPEDVEELTWLFEEIRYGNAPVTDERERRARDALRRIESTYGDGAEGRE